MLRLRLPILPLTSLCRSEMAMYWRDLLNALTAASLAREDKFSMLNLVYTKLEVMRGAEIQEQDRMDRAGRNLIQIRFEMTKLESQREAMEGEG